MYIEFNEELLKKVKEATLTRYETRGDLLNVESIVPMIEDLLCEIHSLKEQIKDIEEDRDENYRPLSKEEQYE